GDARGVPPGTEAVSTAFHRASLATAAAREPGIGVEERRCMLTFIRSRLVATLVVQLALATSVSLVARAEPAGTKAAAPGFASDGRIDFGTNVLTQAEINRSFRPRLAGYILNNTMVSGLVGDGDELVIEAAVSPAAVTDGTSNTIMFGELVLRRTGFMDY